MRRHGQLWERIITAENIALAYQKARKGKAALRGVINFTKDETGNLEKVRLVLTEKTFRTSAYTAHTIHEPKTRTIYALPFFPDRIVQHALMNILTPIWTSLFISDSYACIEGLGIHAGSRRCMEFVRQNRYCLQADASKFYPSVNHAILKRIVRQKIKCPNTLWLIDDIIDSFPGETNIPIGNLTSQWFGNLYLNELDQYAKNVLKIKCYIRYCDDYLAFDNIKSRLREWGEALRDFCKNRLALTLSKSEVFPTSQGVDFLGYRHFPAGYILLRKSTAKRMRRKMEAADFPDKPFEYRRSFLASIKGWVEHANCHNFAKAVRLYERIAETTA
jgi:retron-type reverse transcriptase